MLILLSPFIFNKENYLKFKIIFFKDKDAYQKLDMYYLDSSQLEKLIFYSYYLADKDNYNQACLDVFFHFYDKQGLKTNNNRLDLDSLSSKERQTALKYLVKASEFNHPQARWILSDYYLRGKYFEKDSIKALELKRKN